MSRDAENDGDSRRRTVFLSYAREDQAQAAQLARALEDSGFDVWWDTLIHSGAEFSKTIEAALEKCDAVVVVWSRASVRSDWVLDEASRARDLRKLVPLSLDGTAPPLGFRQYHFVDLSHWRGDPKAGGMIELIRGITAAGSQARADSVAAAPARTQGRGLSRRGLAALGLATAGAGIAGALAWQRGWFSGPAASRNSVAVLPFVNLSKNPDQDYFSDGLSEELRATLARNLKLLVMAQASSSRFRARRDDAVTIAAKLGVAFLLDGSVRRAGEVVRVTVDLIDGETGFSRWSRTFERKLQDIFAVQSEIADTVARALTAEVDAGAVKGSQEAPAVSGGTTNVEAYDAYLRGRALYDLSSDEASERAALARFDAAIAADPGYAAAHAARARSLTAIANQYGKVAELVELYDAAIVSARRAIALAPQMAEGHSTLGFTLFQGRLDARAAREPFERSRQLGAGEATVLARYAQYSARAGRSREASDAMQRALVLDKLNPLIHRAAGSIAYAARLYADSIPPTRQALAMNPELSRAHAAIGDALTLLSRPEEARAEYRAEPVADFRLAGLAIVERRLGNAAAANSAWSQLVAEHGERVLYQQAQVRAQWADREAALTALERAYRIGDSGLIYLRNDPFLDPVRDDPRFTDLLGRIGFG